MLHPANFYSPLPTVYCPLPTFTPPSIDPADSLPSHPLDSSRACKSSSFECLDAPAILVSFVCPFHPLIDVLQTNVETSGMSHTFQSSPCEERSLTPWGIDLYGSDGDETSQFSGPCSDAPRRINIAIEIRILRWDISWLTQTATIPTQYPLPNVDHA